MKDEVYQIVSEYCRFRETGCAPPQVTLNLPDGSTVELCQTNGCDWTLCALRAGDRAVTPIAVENDVKVVMSRYEELLRTWDPALWPPLSIVVAGVTRVFAPAGMSLLLGVLEFGRGALLIGVVKRNGRSCTALVHVDERQVGVLHLGGPADLRGIDLDGLLELQAGTVLSPTTSTGTLEAELMAAFARLLARALKPRGSSKSRRRGVGSVHLFVWALVQLVRMGADDLFGRRGDIQAQLQSLLPGLDLSRRGIGEVLTLMLATKTCLVTCEGRVTWRIRVAGLGDMASALCKKFCAEAPKIKVDIESFSRACSGDIPPPRSKYRGPSPRSAQITRPEVGDTDKEAEGSPLDGASEVAVDAPTGSETDPPEEGVLLTAERGDTPEESERTALGGAGAVAVDGRTGPETGPPKVPELLQFIDQILMWTEGFKRASAMTAEDASLPSPASACDGSKMVSADSDPSPAAADGDAPERPGPPRQEDDAEE